MTTKIAIQIYSDLHIELMKQFPQIQPTSKYLFLVGDICQLNHPLFFKFFDYCSPLWKKIFYTPGNHEFYSGKKNYNELDFLSTHRQSHQLQRIREPDVHIFLVLF